MMIGRLGGGLQDFLDQVARHRVRFDLADGHAGKDGFE